MNAWWVCLPLNRLTFYRRHRASTCALSFTLMLLLSGCVDRTHSRIAIRDVEEVTPKEQVTDYRLAQCDNLWNIEDRDALNNALYWLRAIDCAGRLTPFQARQEAQRLTGDSWSQSFKQSILLDQLKLTPAERRLSLEHLSLFQQDYPAALRPLLQNWRDRQTFWLALTDERLRYQRLQETSDKQMDVMRAQQNSLQYQLDVTTRKLENLTDIERQLSTRKPITGELPENATSHDTGVKSTTAPKEDHKRE